MGTVQLEQVEARHGGEVLDHLVHLGPGHHPRNLRVLPEVAMIVVPHRRRDTTECLVGEHHTEPEGVRRCVALPRDNFMARHLSADSAGALCPCGNRGCLVQYASLPAVLAALAPVLGEDAGLDELLAAAADGQPDTVQVLRGGR